MARGSHIFLLLLSLCIFSAVSADVILSVDCGSSDLIYTDRNGIVWTGDDNLIQNGISRVVQTSNSMSQVMDTLRVFTSRKKNCYSIKVNKGEQVLVRASFYYGNYDTKSSPPSFELQFDGNHWDMVHTYIDRMVYYEVIYVVKGDFTSICLAQTEPGQFPFISALEIHSLGATMYGHVSANYALLMKRRLACGSNQTIRYPDDIYDRIWSPMPGGKELIPVTSDALFISNDGGDNPPENVLKNAITTSDVSQSIKFVVDFPSFEVPVYINMYFSEVTQLDSTQKRSFRVFKGNQPVSSPILPPYGNFTEMYVSNLTITDPNTTFFLVATPDSTLPPLINAVELYYISDPLTNGTNSKDMDGLGSLQSAFDALQDWTSDPCLPSPYSWDWLNCNDDDTPRVTALYLSSFNLLGKLPDFSSMDSLETIDLHNNSLTGQIPDFLATFPNLKQLNLADNQFSGPIPSSLSKKNGLNLVVSGNPDLCSSGKSCQSTSPSSGSSNPGGVRPRAGVAAKKKKSNKLPIILGTTIPAFILIWAIVGILAILHQNNKRKAATVAAANQGQTGGGNMSPMPLLNPQMMGNVGEVAMNEIKVDTNENVTDQRAQQARNGGRNG